VASPRCSHIERPPVGPAPTPAPFACLHTADRRSPSSANVLRSNPARSTRAVLCFLGSSTVVARQGSPSVGPPLSPLKGALRGPTPRPQKDLEAAKSTRPRRVPFWLKSHDSSPLTPPQGLDPARCPQGGLDLSYARRRATRMVECGKKEARSASRNAHCIPGLAAT